MRRLRDRENREPYPPWVLDPPPGRFDEAKAWALDRGYTGLEWLLAMAQARNARSR